MHLLKSFALLEMAFPVTLMAKDFIHFFDEANYSGDYETRTVEVDACKAIPDSNVRGDCGSSVYVSRLPSHVYVRILCLSSSLELC